MLKKSLKILLGMLLIPFCLGFTWQLGDQVFSIRYKPGLPYYFTAGCLAYLTAHVLFRKPILAYVFGHELTHALFALLFGGSVKAFHATERGGQVTITRSNFLITLAPYFFPLYTFLALALFFLLQSARVEHAAPPAVFFTGASFSFHILLTVIFLRTDQQDIREQGAVFSYPLIYLFNVVFSALLLHLLLAEQSRFSKFLVDGILFTVRISWLAVHKIRLLFL